MTITRNMAAIQGAAMGIATDMSGCGGLRFLAGMTIASVSGTACP